MPITTPRRTAEHFYDTGRALFQQCRYKEALEELKRSEDAFRALDVRGHPFSPHRLSNGVSGLANALVLSGLCCQKLEQYKMAAKLFETAFVNAKFEKRKAFQILARTIAENLVICYEKIQDGVDRAERDRLLTRDPAIDIAFQFPHSLSPDSIPLARLFELAPDRYAHYRDFYQRSRWKDTETRRLSKTSDESAMKRMSFYVWAILLTIWAIYGLIVIDALGIIE